MYDIAFFSSRGPSRDGRVQPYISAPGVGIVAPLSQITLNDPAEEYFRYMNRMEYNGYYCTLQGTSMSSPHATGSVALLLEEAMNGGISPTPDDVKNYLKQGANHDSYTGLDPGDVEDSNNDWGYGKIDVTEFLLALGPPPLAITTTTLADGAAGSPYSETLAAEGGVTPYTWSIVAGSLPDGLSLNPGAGEISGTPSAAGTSNFTARVTDFASDTDDQPLSITIADVDPPPEVAGCAPDSGSRGQTLTVTISGANFDAGASVSFGAGVQVRSTTVTSASAITCIIKVKKNAALGSRDIVVTNPDAQSGTLVDGFLVTS